MDGLSFREVGSFAAVVLPVVATAMWLVQKMFTWFTGSLTREQQERAKLTDQLINLIQSTMADHAEQARLLAGLEQRNTAEHQKMMEWMSRKAA